MDILEKFIRQVSYKFPKGYPDLDNEADKKLLFELFEAETEAAPKDRSIYDRIIAKVLTGNEDGEIPEPSRVYTVGKPVNLSGEDEQIFSKLYPISPPKAGKDFDSAGSKGSGNGEIAMYWLLSKGHTVEDSRGRDNPDLIVDGKGLEVKAYESTTVTLGRYGSDRDSLAILGVIFGISNLVGTFKGDKRTVSPQTFNTEELEEAFKRMSDFSDSKLREMRKEYPIIESIFVNIDKVLEALGLDKEKLNPRHATAFTLKQLLKTKLAKKPGIGGYIVNVTQKGSIEYVGITEDFLKSLSDDQLIKGVSTNQGALNIIPNTLFPS